jgi:hypothetical protein
MEKYQNQILEQNTNPNWLVEKAKKINRPKQALAPSKLIDDKTLTKHIK